MSTRKALYLTVLAVVVVLFAILFRQMSTEGKKLAIYADHARLVQAWETSGDVGGPSERDPQWCYDNLVDMHSMERGSSLVLARYKLGDGDASVLDDESFEFLSIEMPRDLVGRPLNLPTPGVTVRFSTGGQFHFLRCEGAIGTLAGGQLRTSAREDGSLEVTLDLEVALKDAKQLTDDRLVRVREDFVALKVGPTVGPSQISPGFLPF